MTPFEPLKYRLLTEIQLNKNYSARLHVDKNNSGPSWIVAHLGWLIVRRLEA